MCSLLSLVICLLCSVCVGDNTLKPLSFFFLSSSSFSFLSFFFFFFFHFFEEGGGGWCINFVAVHRLVVSLFVCFLFELVRRCISLLTINVHRTLQKQLPRWPSGKGVRLESGRPALDSLLRCESFFSGSSQSSDLRIGSPVATLRGAWRYMVSAVTGRPGVSTQ